MKSAFTLWANLEATRLLIKKSLRKGIKVNAKMLIKLSAAEIRSVGKTLKAKKGFSKVLLTM